MQDTTLSPCERLPDEVLLPLLELVMLRFGQKRWCGSLRGVSRQWRAVHDGTCESLHVDDGVTGEVMHTLCGRLPALTGLSMRGVTSLTANGLRAVGGLTTLTILDLGWCDDVTDEVLWELRGLTALTWLKLNGCSQVTNLGLQHLSSLTALTKLWLSYSTYTTQAGRTTLEATLKAALPALTEISFG